MYLTGFDNVIISNTRFISIKDKFEKLLLKEWKDFKVKNLDNNGKEFFYYKDDEMLKEFEDLGYKLNKDQESPFLIISEKHNLLDFNIDVNNQIAPILEYEVERYDSKLILNDSYIYTLVTPESILTDSFSKFLYDKFIYALKSQ